MQVTTATESGFRDFFFISLNSIRLQYGATRHTNVIQQTVTALCRMPLTAIGSCSVWFVSVG
jgi:hypothetical protein